MKYAEAGRLKHVLKMLYIICLPLTALIFMSLNFVILFTITSIQIYEEELICVYFQLMYYS